ncbi:hypothetical protein [Pseudomonas peli]|uniref:hypothetical protein n=1 Tax=Pseudomonas peli TaxID=592361 RepID=UPI003D154351
MHPRVLEVTERLIARSRATREGFLQLIRGAASDGPMRGRLQCANFAHGVAGCGSGDKHSLRMMNAANVAIVSSYNDMLSAHQPYEHFPGADQEGPARGRLGRPVRRWRARPCAMA